MQSWQNFDVEFFDHDTIGDVESVKVRVARSPAGVQRDAVTVEIAASLRAAAEELAQDTMSLEQTVALGKGLAGVLLPNIVADLFDKSRARLEPDQGLRIRIELRSLPLADLPWEYVYRQPGDGDESGPERGFLALDRTLSVVRYEPVAQPPGTCTPLDGAPVTVAMLMANPQIPGWAMLDLASELRAVESALDDEPDVALSVHPNATERTLNDVLDARPHAFHFSGHGRFKLRQSDRSGVYVGEGELLFETDAGGVEPVSARELAVKMRGSGVRLAVLNSCESARRDSLNAFTGVAPTLVRDGVPAVVAMQYAIRDAHALSFARRFYHNLAAHQSIDSAVTAARLAMFDVDGRFDRDWGIPVLYLRSDQAVLFPDRTTAAKPSLQKLGAHGWVNLVLSTALIFVLAFFYLRHVEPRLPFGSIVGGVLALAVVTAMVYLSFIAEDYLRYPVLAWLRRRLATGLLGGALVALVAALWLTPAPVGVRVVPGKTLMSLIPAHDLANPVQTYQLVIKVGTRDSSAADFRKSGVIIAGSPALAARLARRFKTESAEQMTGYLQKNGLENFRESFLGLWRPQPTPWGVSGLGKAGTLTLILKKGNAEVSCKSLPATALADNMTVIFLENGDVCQ